MNILGLTGADSAAGANCNCDVQVVAGVEAELFYVPSCEIDVFPQTLEKSGNGSGVMADAVTLDGDIVLDAVNTGLGYFRKYSIIINSGKVMNTAVGELGSKSFDTDLAFRIKGNDPEHLGFANNILNCKGTWLVKTKDGVPLCIGNKTNPAYVESLVLDTGDTPESANQGTYLIRGNTGYTSFVYPGVIDLTPNP